MFDDSAPQEYYSRGIAYGDVKGATKESPVKIARPPLPVTPVIRPAIEVVGRPGSTKTVTPETGAKVASS